MVKNDINNKWIPLIQNLALYPSPEYIYSIIYRMISSIYETIFVVSYLEMLYILNFWDDNLISGKVDEDDADDADYDNDDD